MVCYGQERQAGDFRNLASCILGYIDHQLHLKLAHSGLFQGAQAGRGNPVFG